MITKPTARLLVEISSCADSNGLVGLDEHGTRNVAEFFHPYLLTCPISSRTDLLGLPIAKCNSVRRSMLRWLPVHDNTSRVVLTSTAFAMALKEASVPPHADTSNSSNVLRVGMDWGRQGSGLFSLFSGIELGSLT